MNWVIIVRLNPRLENFFKNKSCWNNNPHNPPNDYEGIHARVEDRFWIHKIASLKKIKVGSIIS